MRSRGQHFLDKYRGFVWGDVDFLGEKSGFVWLGLSNATFFGGRVPWASQIPGCQLLGDIRVLIVRGGEDQAPEWAQGGRKCVQMVIENVLEPCPRQLGSPQNSTYIINLVIPEAQNLLKRVVYSEIADFVGSKASQ